MSLFHRRSRSASASRPQTPASASAHMAATQAFLANRASQSQSNLSASAAATALRTMSPSPTPVDQVQTKRMIQRQASLSQLSSGSGRGRSRGGLQRQRSYGSMTERSFRTPSPSPSRQPSRLEAVPAPPLPSIPQQFASAPAVSGKKQKRASSQGAPPPRVLSPPPTQKASRGQSLDRFGSSQTAVASPGNRQNNILPQLPELERTDSRNSINFSRPLSPRPQSPAVPQPLLTNGDRSLKIPNAQPISPAEAEQIQYDLVQRANQPVKKKKKKVPPAAAEGSHLHTGTMASKPVVHPLEPESEPASQPQAPLGDEAQPRARRKKKKGTLSGQHTQFPSSDTSSRTDSDSDSNAEKARERRAQRASGTLVKQPSIVREDWEGEQEETAGAQLTPVQPTVEQDVAAAQDSLPLQGKRAYNTANVSRKIEEPAPPTKVTTQAVPADSQTPNASKLSTSSPKVSSNLQLMEPHAQRENSLSPSRSTRFSDRLSSDLAAGRKHEPLPRSVSPAKSALKHHYPSAGDSQRVRGSSITPSESSDISSASLDGMPRQKKSVRVSFDAQPEIVGASDGVQSTESPSKEKKSWPVLGKTKPTLNTIPSNDDMEELMKPRPQLPSFGSVRGQKFRDASEASLSQSSKSPSSSASASTSSVNTYSLTGVSSDHAVGAILAQEQQRAASQGSNEPLPPEVTSVHGNVSFSDSESDTSEIEEPPLATNKIEEEPGAPTTSSSGFATINQQVTQPEVSEPVNSPIEVPVVSVSPPTPKLEDQWEVVLPGGFPVSHEALAQLSESQKEPKQPNLELSSTTESESDNESIYSDAAEDPAELDGTGFGSIDAIVDSPIVAHASLGITSPPESPLTKGSEARPQPVLVGSWEQTQARWRDLAEQSRRAPEAAPAVQSEPPVEPSTGVASLNQETSMQQTLPASQKSSQPKSMKTPAAIAARASIPNATRTAKKPMGASQRKKNQPSGLSTIVSGQPGPPPGPASHFRHSMRAASPVDAELTMRKSMRNRNSMPAHAPISQQQRPSTLPSNAPMQPRAALQKKSIPPTSLSTSAAATVSAPRPAPAQTSTTNDSDSDSSFRRVRRSKSTAGGKYTMRRSMRGASDATLRDSGRNGVRSVSPVGRRPFSSGVQHTMRSSMRGSIDSSVPTLRGSTDAKRSSSLFGRGQERVPSQAVMAKHRSRFAVDSDDEDDRPKPGRWVSRFAVDSDDEDDLTPVRGIPRRAEDHDSTDLEDSSDEERPKTPIQPSRLQIPQDVMSPAGSEAMSPNTAKKRGLFGRLRGKKQKGEASSPVVESTQMPTTNDLSKPANLGFSSKAERDRMIEQTRARLEAAQAPSQPTNQTHHKLQRRQAPQRIMSDSWPLPPKIPESEENTDIRPNTADGPPVRNGSTRLTRGSMRIQEVPLEPVGRGGKKKRFPMLRKAFGLRD